MVKFYEHRTVELESSNISYEEKSYQLRCIEQKLEDSRRLYDEKYQKNREGEINRGIQKTDSTTIHNSIGSIRVILFPG